MLVAAQAQAALPAALTTALGEVEDNIALLETAIWPVIIASTMVFLYIKLARRGINKV